MASLEHLPIEVVVYIASYISPKDLCNCSAVCRKWHDIFNENAVWNKLCNRTLGKYLERAICRVEPNFSMPTTLDSNSSKLSYIREQHLWNNWRSGRFKIEEIEFDWDDSLSYIYNIEIEFVANDYVFIHTTFKTEVWDVTKEPCLLMSIPFCLKEWYEECKVVENKLVVIQRNVVQVFNICLVSKSWAFAFAFFFDKSEEVSSNITGETDIDKVFQETSAFMKRPEDIEGVICGDFMIGVVVDSNSLKKPVMHIWNIKSGKKVKEEKCPDVKQVSSSFLTGIVLTVPESSTRTILFTYEIDYTFACSLIYDMVNLEFVLDHYYIGCVLLYDSHHLLVYHSPETCLINYDSNNYKVFKISGESSFYHSNCQLLGNKLLVGLGEEIVLINPSNTVFENLGRSEMEVLVQVSFKINGYEVLKDSFLVLQDFEYSNSMSVREIWEVGKQAKKVISFREDLGTYRISNEVCSKIVLEHAKKMIVLSFW